MSSRTSFNPDVTDSIATALRVELAEKGYRGMSMDGLAERAGVGKAAIYRRWSSKEEMVVDLLREQVVPDHDFPDHGSLRGDLHGALTELREWFGDETSARIFMEVLTEGKRSHAMGDLLSLYIGRPRRRRGAALLERAIERGEIEPGHDHELVLDLLASTVFWRMVARRTTFDDDDMETVIDMVVDYLGVDE